MADNTTKVTSGTPDHLGSANTTENTAKVTSGTSDHLSSANTKDADLDNLNDAQNPSITETSTMEGAVYHDAPAELTPEMVAARAEVYSRYAGELKMSNDTNEASTRIKFLKDYTLNGIDYEVDDEIMVNESTAKSLEASKTARLV